MDLAASIWLSSVAGALLFFSGGRLWGRATSRREALAPVVHDDGAARALDTELARVAALHDQLALAEKRLAELRDQLAVERTRAEDTAWLEAENVALRRKVEEQHPAEAPLDDAQRHNLEPRPQAGQKLEQAIEGRLDELRLRRGSCQTAVLGDVRGLLLASCGDATHDEALAAAAAMITETGERMRLILPLGELLEMRLTDVNRAVFAARWLGDDQERYLLGTLGVTHEKMDPRADAIEASVSDLLRAPAPPSAEA